MDDDPIEEDKVDMAFHVLKTATAVGIDLRCSWRPQKATQGGPQGLVTDIEASGATCNLAILPLV
eukprot:2882408-Karenia_brevis.AAC.1